jgi:uncharacterized protein (DUF433 family)/DNA-binding transcriptional MerR regulator
MPTASTMNSGGETSAFGAGLYSVADMSRLLGVYGVPARPATVGRWARDGLVIHREGRPEYSFHDLISMLVVAWLREQGVKLADIRRAETHLSRAEGVVRPFALREIYTDGFNVLYRANPAMVDQITAANRGGQEVIEPALRDSLRSVAYENDLAAWWQVAEGVTVDPRIQWGDPCVADRGLRTAQIAGMIGAGETRESVAHFYGLALDAVNRAIQFEESLALASSRG